MIPLAALDTVSLLSFLQALLAGILGAVIGILRVGLRVGAWRKEIERGLKAEAAARTAQAEADRTGRERVHRDLDEMKHRLSEGDKRFDSLIGLAETARILTRDLNALGGALDTLVTKDLCAERHRLSLSLADAAAKLVLSLERVAAAIEKAAHKLPQPQ